jgi:hypothetical protein
LAQHLERYQGLDLYALDEADPRAATDFFGGSRATRPLDALIALAMRASANRIVVEEDYIDFVYRDEYASFYGGIYSNYGAQCRRLTFFSSEESTVLGLLDGNDSKCIGFTVLRPTLVGRVGRTLLPPPAFDECTCLPCTGKYKLHLLGRQFEISGFPFMQQDGQVMRCAQVSMLMCMLYLQRAQSEPLSLPHEISEVATREFVQLGRPFPSVGLLPSEINHFLWRVGYGPVRYDSPTRDENKFETLIFIPYLLSQLPALLLSEDHSVVAVGFSFQFDRKVSKPVGRIQDYVGEIIVHDDGVGPYDTLALPAGASLEEESPGALGRFGQIRSVIIPCPRKMYLRASHAEFLAGQLLRDRDMHTYIAARASEGCPMARVANEIYAGRVDGDQLVMRPVLMTSQKLKEEALRRRGALDSQVCKTICEAHLPRIVWVVEVATLSSMKGGKWESIGEIVLDATGHVAAKPELIVHLPGILMSSVDDGAYVDVADETPYDSWLLHDSEAH